MMRSLKAYARRLSIDYLVYFLCVATVEFFSQAKLIEPQVAYSKL